jgi:CBS-domain-containing membrane protein
MNKNLRVKILNEFRQFWKNYVFQSLFATLTIFIVLLLFSLENAAIIASIGATTFIVFATPKSITARPRNVIGGHLVGLISGSLFSLISHSSFLSTIVICSLAVGISIFIMVVIDTEHPPAAGTALGIAITGFSVSAAIAVITSAVTLSLVHFFFRKYLRDLI